MRDILHTDVLVVGGGAAGVAAAVAASGKGLKVTLLERNLYLGGKATAAEVGTVCGLYAFSRLPDTKYIVKGFAKEFAASLQQRSGTIALKNNEGLHYLPYDIAVFKQICLEYLNENKVNICFNSILEAVYINDEKISAVAVKTGDTIQQYHVKALVDCSGDAAISRAANLEIIASDRYQAAAQVFSLKNISEENEARLGMILIKALRSAIDEKKLPDFFDRVYIVQGSLKNNHVSLKLGIPVKVTYKTGNLEEINRSANDFVQDLTDFLVKNIPAFQYAVIDHIAPETGLRVGARSLGKYMLTAEDVLQCNKFDDAIANGSWPIEEWGQHKRVQMQYFNYDDFYQVPARCLRSKNIGNLFMGGRNISATDTAIASARVMGTCLQTGYAAGYMAAAMLMGINEQAIINDIQTRQL
ncbi:FAD-dependent oxidoreductase [soil metagenome]